MMTDNLAVPPANGTGRVEARNALTAETVDEFCKALGISRSLAYRLASKGELRLVKLGSRTLVPSTERARLLGVRPLSNSMA